MDARAPPRFPHVFITAETEPAKIPPISKVSAHETPTVTSSPNITSPDKSTHAPGFVLLYAGQTETAARAKPQIATSRRDRARFPERFTNTSEIHPPNKSPRVPAIRGTLAYTPIASRLSPRAAF